MSYVTQLTPQQLAALRAIDSPTIANAIEEFDVRDPSRRVHGWIRPLHLP